MGGMTSRRPSAPRVRSGVDAAHASQLEATASPRSARAGAQEADPASSGASRDGATTGRGTATATKAPRDTSSTTPSGRAPSGSRSRRARLTSRPSARRGSGWSQARPERRPRPAAADRSATDKPSAERAAPPAITLRTLALGLVVLVAFIVVAPTLRAYVTQREQYRQVNAQLASVGASVDHLDRELARWQDPGFVQAQARDRLAFVLPGEVPYRVIDPQVVVGEDESVGELGGLTEATDTAPVVPWYLTMWDSVVDAGEPLEKVDEIDILTGAPSAAGSAADAAADGAAER